MEVRGIRGEMHRTCSPASRPDRGEAGASAVLGKQLLPRLEVDYAVGLLGAPNVARLRYRLGRGWYLQSESGRETGSDLVYLLEER